MNIFYTPDLSGNEYILPEEESKHCIRVLRKKINDELMLVDGKGTWYKVSIVDDHPKKCRIKVLDTKNNFEKRAYYLHLAVAPTKNNDRFEWFLEKATEIGIDEITPLFCEHSVRDKINSDRLQKVIISAMKQSLKAYLPKLNNLTNFDAFLKGNHQGKKMIAHCVDGQKGYLFNSIEKKESVCILIGPEGDFSDEEIKKAIESGFTPVSLGKSRLRTETAALVATQIVNVKNEAEG